MGNVNLLIYYYDYGNGILFLDMTNFSFEDKFRYDEQGVPRIWKPSDDIDGIFKSAREEVSTYNFPAYTDTPLNPCILRNHLIKRKSSNP